MIMERYVKLYSETYFLSSLNYEQVKKDEHFIPFGIGKRVCLGETLAKVKKATDMRIRNINFIVRLSSSSFSPTLCTITTLPLN